MSPQNLFLFIYFFEAKLEFTKNQQQQQQQRFYMGMEAHDYPVFRRLKQEDCHKFKNQPGL